MRRSVLFRSCLWTTVICVIAGVIIELGVSAHRSGGYFSSPLAKALNLFAYFTILSNIIVAITSGLLALNRQRLSSWFWGFRLSGLVSIVITFIVQHFFLAGPLQGWALIGDTLVHTIVPILVVVIWLLWGPRGLINRRTIGIATIFPIAWIVFTMIRGHIIGWYPYAFLNVVRIGYIQAYLHIAGIVALFFILSSLAYGYEKLRA